ANNAGGGSLSLRPGCTYTLTTPLPDITGRLVIDANRSTITRDTTAPSFTILTVRGSLALDAVTISGGDSPNFIGGGILNHGRLTLTAGNITGNRALVGGGIGTTKSAVTEITSSNIMGNQAIVNGGGISNDATMTVASSRVIDNTAQSLGGGIASRGRLQVLSSNVVENHAGKGGGLANILGTTRVFRSNINDNTADAAPGGILNSGIAVLLESSRVRGNTPTNCAGSLNPVPGCVG
ncbi:hypothetical protein, partial [Wenjunlia vitaminophila]